MGMLSIWETGSFHRRPQVVVVGAGLVGCFTALFHKRAMPHHHVLLLEQGAFPAGASVKNAGFACFGSPSELVADIAAEGLEAALARVEQRWLGLRELRQELGDEAIGFAADGGHEIFAAHDPLYTQVCEAFDGLNDALRPLLGTTAYAWDDSRIAGLGLAGVQHLAHTTLEGALDSGKLVSTLLRKCSSEGVLFRPNCHVAEVQEQHGHVELVLASGERLTADRVVLATNGYTKALRPELDVVPARGQVVLTDPVPGLRLKGCFHHDAGFYYFRELNGAVLLGGGRNLDIAGETTADEGTSPVVQDALERLLRDVILPGQPFRIAQRWSGIMAFGSRSKTPLVERISERVVVAARLGGMGVAIGIRVARRAAALLD
jgi:gamma-glutamylputrescine oxidase